MPSWDYYSELNSGGFTPARDYDLVSCVVLNKAVGVHACCFVL